MSIKSFVVSHAVGAICTIGVLALAVIVLLINWGIKSSRIKYARKVSEIFADENTFKDFVNTKTSIDNSFMLYDIQPRKRNFADKDGARREFINDSLGGELSDAEKYAINTTFKKIGDTPNRRNECIEIIGKLIGCSLYYNEFKQYMRSANPDYVFDGKKIDDVVSDIEEGKLGINGENAIINTFNTMKMVQGYEDLFNSTITKPVMKSS